MQYVSLTPKYQYLDQENIPNDACSKSLEMEPLVTDKID